MRVTDVAFVRDIVQLFFVELSSRKVVEVVLGKKTRRFDWQLARTLHNPWYQGKRTGA